MYKGMHQPGLHFGFFHLRDKSEANCGNVALFMGLCRWLLLGFITKKGMG